MAALFASSALWKSKFSLSRERGFLNEILPVNNPKSANIPRKWERKEKEEKKSIDWRLLYHCSNPRTKMERDSDFRPQIRQIVLAD